MGSVHRIHPERRAPESDARPLNAPLPLRWGLVGLVVAGLFTVGAAVLLGVHKVARAVGLSKPYPGEQ